MSGTINLASTPFTDAERADIRRFCGYQFYGSGASGFQGWRYFTAYGTLEYELTNLAPAEFQVVRGKLADLYTLEAALPAMSATQNVGSAGPYKTNVNEFAQRQALYRAWRTELCAIIGIPPGPGLQATAGTRIVI